MTFFEKLLTVAKEGHVKTDELMFRHTTFRVGGPAAYFVRPDEEKELGELIRLCRNEGVPYFLLGNGSNLLVGDGGYDGVILYMRDFSRCQRNEGSNTITAGAGVTLAAVGNLALKEGLDGFVFASRIPGSVGGSVAVNAGAYGYEMKDVLKWVRVMDREGRVMKLSVSDLRFGYRTSSIPRENYIVLEACFELKPGNREEIWAGMEELAAKRKSKQPLTYPSAGSVFKRPPGYYAGKLIQDAGLSGYRVGGAEVSRKHCGFVINRDHATASDIMMVCKDIKERVLAMSGVALEMEVRTLGSFSYIQKETEVETGNRDGHVGSRKDKRP